MSPLALRRLALCTLAAIALPLGRHAAQSLYTMTPAGGVMQITGPPAGPCAYPTGPILPGFPYFVPFACPLPGPVLPPAPPFFGDVAVNRAADTVWVTDGALIGSYTSAGVPISAFPVPPIGLAPLTGLGYDAVAGILWMTDGALAAAIFPPLPPACFGPVPILAIPPFPLPPVPGPYTDIDWDTGTGTLFLCTAGGFVANVLIGGALGPFGLFFVGPACPLGPLVGIAVDSAAPAGSGTFYATDGFLIAHLLPGGAPAPPTFASTAVCTPIPGPPTQGLAFAARPVAYGAPFPGPGPTIGAIGQSTSPNPAFALTLAGAPPGSVAVAYRTASFSCPPVLAPFPIYLGLATPAFLITAAVVPPSGAITTPVPLPPGLPASLTAYVQWFVVLPVGLPPIWASPGLELAISLP